MVESLRSNIGISLVFEASLIILFVCLGSNSVERVQGAAIVNLTWVVSYEYKYLDCYKRLSISINGMTPGPPIDAAEGDRVIINVVNNLIMENVAIHWHGIRQFGTQWSDGTDSVTECSTVPGDNFVYDFFVDKAGTYMYHSHYGMQREAGLYGLIRVAPFSRKEPFSYDGDIGIVLSDWYHTSPYEQATNLASTPYVWIGEPQSLMINGRGKYNCTGLSADICNATNPQCSPSVFTVMRDKTYRFRIASLTSLSALSFQIQDHNMTIIEADGSYVEPVVVENLYIYSGETYSVLIKTKDLLGMQMNYWISINVVSRKPATPNALAILNYYQSPPVTPSSPPPPGPLWNDTTARVSQSRSIKARAGYIIPPPDSYKTIILLNTQNTVNGITRWSLNNVLHNLPSTPYLISLKMNWTDTFNQTPPPENYDPSYDIYAVSNNTNATVNTSIYRLKFNETVDMVLQNANTMNQNDSETHPWHLHGHDFRVLHYGDGQFNLTTDVEKYNLKDPTNKIQRHCTHMDGQR